MLGKEQFIPSTLKKIKLVRDLIDKSEKQIRLEVDGGINLNNLEEIAKAGADTFVAGSAIFNSKNYVDTIKKMRDILSSIGS